jgi:hypothetical protein
MSAVIFGRQKERYRNSMIDPGTEEAQEFADQI